MSDRSGRLYYVDWLRIAAVLLLIPFHTALMFSLSPGDVVYIKHAVDFPVSRYLAGFVHLRHMPLLFLLGGASSWFALDRRPPGRYVRERVLRLLVPFVFATAVLIPPMTYIARAPSVSFGRHYLGFFDIDFSALAGLSGTWTPAHTWFVLYLFILSLILLPIFLAIKRRTESDDRFRRGLGRIMTFASRPWMMPLFFVPLAASYLLPAPEGDKGPAYFLVWIFYGFLFAASPTFQTRAAKHKWINLGIAAVSLGLYYISSSGSETVGFLLRSLSRWSWVLFFLGLGKSAMDRGGGMHAYLSKAAYPIYLLHMPVNTAAGWLVLNLPLPAVVQFLIIVIVTTSGTLLIYEFVVRRLSPLRFCFGMKIEGRTRISAVRKGGDTKEFG